MIALVRLEAEGKSLIEVAKELDAAAKSLALPDEKLRVHDEHYERVHDTCFKGRRVFRPGNKTPGANLTEHIRALEAQTSTTGATYRKG
jgi:hypothetical protein